MAHFTHNIRYLRKIRFGGTGVQNQFRRSLSLLMRSAIHTDQLWISEPLFIFIIDTYENSSIIITTNKESLTVQNSMKCIPYIQRVHTEELDDLAEAVLYCYKMYKDYMDELKEQK